MERKSIAQEYYVLAVKDTGYMPPMRRDESNAGLVAAAIMDMLLSGCITLKKKKITVIRELPRELGHLEPLYAYLREKPRSTNKVMSDYIAAAKHRLRLLTVSVCEALLEEQAVIKGEGGLLDHKTIYIPVKEYKNEVVKRLKSAVETNAAAHDMALIWILKETGNLNQYFSPSERDVLKVRLKGMKQNPESGQLAGMIDYVSDMTAVMAAFVVNGCL